MARWIVTTELARAEGALLAHTAAASVFQKLSQGLSLLITPVGSEAVLARAVHLSRAGFPFLDGAHITRSADAVTLTLRDSATAMGSDQACEGFVAVLGSLIALLVSFIGEDLTSRVLRDVWPDIPMVQSVQAIRKNGTVHVEMTP